MKTAAKDSAKAKRVLLMTLLDLDREPNQRTQHMAAMLAGLAGELVVITKTRCLERSPRALLRDALTCKVHSRRNGNVITHRLHPFLNYAQALASAWVSADIGKPAGWRKRVFAAMLSFMGILRDMIYIPTFVLVALIKVGGRFDVCFCDGPWTGGAGWCLRMLGRVRYLIYDDMDYVAGGQMLKLRIAYVAALERGVIGHADLAISAGWRLGAYRESTTGRAITVITNGVDPALFRKALEKPPHPPTLVYVGHLAHYSGVDLAIRSLPSIQTACPGARLIIVGEGDTPYIGALHKLAQDLGVDAHVEFRGRVPYAGLAAVLAECDLGFAASRLTLLRSYAFPLKVIEYMAAGLPVLCTAGSEAAEILRRYPAGCAVAFEVDALANAAIEFFSDAKLYAQARNTALATAELFTWANATDRMRRLIEAQLQLQPAAAQAAKDYPR